MYFTSCSLVPRLPASQRAWIVHLTNVLLGKIVHAEKLMVSDARRVYCTVHYEPPEKRPLNDSSFCTVVARSSTVHVTIAIVMLRLAL